MTTYNIWVGGEHHYYRSYLGEIGYLPLTQEQIDRWCPGEDEDEWDFEAISERLHRGWDEKSDDPADFPSRDEVEEGCEGYGAYTDQTYGISKETEDGDETIWKGHFQDLCYVEDADDEEVCPRVETNCTEPFTDFKEEEFIDIPGIAYNYSYKGGYSVSFELPDDEEFDVRKVLFETRELEGIGDIVTGISYNGESYDPDSDSDGKGCDWYLVKDGEFHAI